MAMRLTNIDNELYSYSNELANHLFYLLQFNSILVFIRFSLKLFTLIYVINLNYLYWCTAMYQSLTMAISQRVQLTPFCLIFVSHHHNSCYVIFSSKINQKIRYST